MNAMKLCCVFANVLLASTMVLAQDSAPPEPGPGFRGGRGFGFGRQFGRGPGQGMMRHGSNASDAESMQGHGGHGADDRHDEDHDVFQFLLQNHSKIKRTVTDLPDGVETLTESDDDEVADKIKEHVEWMQYRVEKVNPIRMRDPLFAELFRHADKIKMVHTDTERGVKVVETSSDPYVAKLIQEHAKVVSGFVARGFAEAMKNHAIPNNNAKVSKDLAFPVIEGHGGVVRLAEAAQQPKPGTKLIVDITKGGDATKLNPGIEKVAKFVNLYAGGGREPADAQFAIVLHGDATLAILNPDAYSEHFKTEGNPNLPLLQQLHEAGVEIYVCGQSLLSLGSQPSDVVVFAETAVSALTAVVNLQDEGFSYVPMLK
ncbi:DsrE family protein [Stieleria sp. JC731]|uniref:DsrE family protein n=1 Tax=Pirellulaceae TaxID=2691357 RepID=UPI001E4798E8|nr:DsrE family protein [Stieleria sp. JC731]MCC9603703.1 DsrE family protein [Stieleria sp. JC731]